MCSRSELRAIVIEEMGDLLIEHSKQSGLPSGIYLENIVNTFLPIAKSPNFKRLNTPSGNHWVHRTIRRIKQLEFGNEC